MLLYDQYGQEIPEEHYSLPHAGRQLVPDISDRIYLDPARNLTPAKVDRILSNASNGDVEEQAELAEMILEKNHAIADAFDVRCKAVLGLPWHVEGSEETPVAKKAADAFEKALRSAGKNGTDSFRSLLSDMLHSLIVGYSVDEIIWGSGGSLVGFASIPARHIDFLHSYEPRIRLSDGGSVELQSNKFIYAKTRLHGSDPCRGGYIRPLAWLFCFMQLGMKDLLSFMERYGMPFVLAKVSDESFQNERNQLLQLIRKFGSGGGGLVTHGTEVEFVQAGNSAGEIYFELQKFLDDSVHRLLLGQTASSGDGGGLSKDGAQDQVRQDLLEADAVYLADVITQQLAIPWTTFNFPPGTPVPRLVFDVTPPEDKEKLASTVKTLFDSGFEADPAEMSEHFGIKLKAKGGQEGNVPAEGIDNVTLKQKYDAMGVAIRAGLLTATPDIEEMTRRELGLPAMSTAVQKAWEATGGIRQPITLQHGESAAVEEALDVESGEDKAMSDLSDRSDKSDRTDNLSPGTVKWLGPLAEELEKLSQATEAGEFGRILHNLAYESEPFGSSGEFEEELEGVIYDGFCAGAMAADRTLSKKLKGKNNGLQRRK